MDEEANEILFSYNPVQENKEFVMTNYLDGFTARPLY